MEFALRIIEHKDVLIGYAHKLCAMSSLDHEDLVQDVFIYALEKQDKYEEQGKLKQWLLAICHNLFINKIRVTIRQNHVNIEDVVLPISANQENVIMLKQIEKKVTKSTYCHFFMDMDYSEIHEKVYPNHAKSYPAKGVFKDRRRLAAQGCW